MSGSLAHYKIKITLYDFWPTIDEETWSLAQSDNQFYHIFSWILYASWSLVISSFSKARKDKNSI